MKKLWRAVWLCVTGIFLMGCGKTQPISKTDFVLDTFCTVTVYDPEDAGYLPGCFSLMRQQEALLSATVSGSDIARINGAKGKAVPVSEDTARLIGKALSYSRLTDGAFDITIYPVSKLWDFRSGEGRVPDAKALKEALKHVDYRKVVLSGNTVQLSDPEAGIELGAIAKGAIADAVSDFLREKGVKRALINLGGNIVCIGKRPDGKAFQIGVKKPFSENGETVAVLPCEDASVVSSGIDERYFTEDGVIYHHILDPKSGYPSQSGLHAVSVLAERSVDADALSTCLFLLGEEKGKSLIKGQKDSGALRAVLIGENNEVLADVNAP